MENAKETVINKQKINYKDFLKISVNEEHKCVAINVSAREFKKQKDYTEFYAYVDKLMIKKDENPYLGTIYS